MEKIGVENLTLEVLTNIEGECSLCDIELLVNDETYVFSEDENLIAAYHSDCFRHMVAVIGKYLEEYGVVKRDNDN